MHVLKRRINCTRTRIWLHSRGTNTILTYCGPMLNRVWQIEKGDPERHSSYFFIPHFLSSFPGDHAFVVGHCIAPRPLLVRLVSRTSRPLGLLRPPPLLDLRPCSAAWLSRICLSVRDARAMCTMRVELVGRFIPCMPKIYPHI